MKRCKFVHLLWQGDALFNKRIVMLITDQENGFNVDDHMFVTPYKHIYDEINMFPNVVFEEETAPQSARFINKYAEYGDWVFLHGLCGVMEVLKIKRKNQKKIIWRTWGHDVHGIPYKKHDFLKNTVKWVLNMRWKAVVRKFRMIGVANASDEVSIRKKFGAVPTRPIDYPAKNNRQILDQIMCDMSDNVDVLNILVGHSGVATDNHFEIIDRLKPHFSENIHLTFVLSYGDEAYIQKVKAYILENCPDKVTIIERKMPFDEYCKLLAQMDVAIFDGVMSYALSNISILLYFRKKIFLNRNGVLAEAFTQEGIPFCCTDELEQVSMESLSSKMRYTNLSETSLYPTSYEKSVARWKKTLALLQE